MHRNEAKGLVIFTHDFFASAFQRLPTVSSFFIDEEVSSQRLALNFQYKERINVPLQNA